MTDPKKPDAVDADDLMIEMTNLRKVDRPKKLDSLVDTQAMRFLEAMDFQSFNNLSGAFEKFMMDAPLFQGDVSFGRAAAALDLTARLFSMIDTDKNHLLSREEFAYLLLKTTEENRMALAWLIENFNAFTQSCFFKDQISKDDIEAGRNVFHGLKVANEKFGFNKQPTLENLRDLDPKQMKDYLDKNRGQLNQQEASGLSYLIDHVKKHVKPRDAAEAKDAKPQDKPISDPLESLLKDKRMLALQGVLDARSLKTLRGLRLNSFESLFNAFEDMIGNALGFKGETPFQKTANSFDTTAQVVSQLELGEEHAFTPGELLIVSKMTPGKDEKRQVGWIAKHFEPIAKIFSLPGKMKKRDMLGARNIFFGLSFLREKFELDDDIDPIKADEFERKVKEYLHANKMGLEPRNRIGMEQLVEFLERHGHRK